MFSLLPEDAMVKSLNAPALPDQTLDALWRATARRTSTRHATACITVGILGMVALPLFDQLRIPGLVGLVVGAFGVYALAVQPDVSGRAFRPRAHRAVAAIAVAIAVVASAAVALLVLAAIFGGNIEVMRR
jgi:hypothetical protein